MIGRRREGPLASAARNRPLIPSFLAFVPLVAALAIACRARSPTPAPTPLVSPAMALSRPSTVASLPGGTTRSLAVSDPDDGPCPGPLPPATEGLALLSASLDRFGNVTARVVRSSPVPPPQESFSFRFCTLNGKFCQPVVIPAWVPVSEAAADLTADEGRRQWLAAKAALSPLYVAEVYLRWDKCSAHDMSGQRTIELYLDGAERGFSRLVVFP
jgi:hypothetical protein